MTTLPSFVELMTTLGIDGKAEKPESPSSRSSPSSSPKLLHIPTSSLRSKSTPSLRDQAASRTRSARYSPYASTFIGERRRGSVSSVSSSSSSDIDGMSERSSSCSPTLPSASPRMRMRKRAHNKLAVNVFGSSTDLSANTPISTYVRRKTPGTSPSSPSFPREQDNSSREFSQPFTIPTLPPFLPRSASSESFPRTPNSDLDDSSSELAIPLVEYGLKPQFPNTEVDLLTRRSRLHTGIRISRASPRYAKVDAKTYHHRVVHVA